MKFVLTAVPVDELLSCVSGLDTRRAVVDGGEVETARLSSSAPRSRRCFSF